MQRAEVWEAFSTENTHQEEGYPSITEGAKVLKFKFDELVQGDDTVAEITIPVTGAANYKDYTITAIVSAPAKIPQTLTFSGELVSKVYGDESFTITPVQGAGEGGYGAPYGAITYSSSQTDVASVDPSTGGSDSGTGRKY